MNNLLNIKKETNTDSAISNASLQEQQNKPPLQGLQELQKAQGEVTTQIEAKGSELNKARVDAVVLVQELAEYFGSRLVLPAGADLLLALFTMNTYTFKLFETVPYLYFTSLVNGCGKTVLQELLKEVCLNPRYGVSFTEASMARASARGPVTIICDESGVLNGKSERAQRVVNIALVGYRKGGKIYRCEERRGKRFEEQALDVFCPKTFAGVEAMQDPALADRFIIIRMPMKKNVVVKTSRMRAINRVAPVLRKKLIDYANQNKETLRRSYDDEPDEGYWPEFENREADLWGVLLIHSRLCGVEDRFLKIAREYSRGKLNLKGTNDTRVLRAIELKEVLEERSEIEIQPSEIMYDLTLRELWGDDLSNMKSDKSRSRSIGVFMTSFHGPPSRKGGGSFYKRERLIKSIEDHIPNSSAILASDAKDIEKKGTFTINEPFDSKWSFKSPEEMDLEDDDSILI